MDETQLKKLVQDSVPVLANIEDILVTQFENDAVQFLQRGAVLLCVATYADSGGQRPFHFALGWPRSAGERPPLWTQYHQSIPEGY